MSPEMSVEEACSLCRCSEETLMKYLRSNKLPSVKVGRRRVIMRDAFIQKLNELALTQGEARTPKVRRRRPLV